MAKISIVLFDNFLIRGHLMGQNRKNAYVVKLSKCAKNQEFAKSPGRLRQIKKFAKMIFHSLKN